MRTSSVILFVLLFVAISPIALQAGGVLSTTATDSGSGPKQAPILGKSEPETKEEARKVSPFNPEELFKAIKESNAEEVQRLLKIAKEQSIDIGTLTDESERTALWKAAYLKESEQSLKIVKALVSHPVPVDAIGTGRKRDSNKNTTPLAIAAIRGNLGVLKFLVDEGGADINLGKERKNESLIERTCLSGRFDSLEALLIYDDHGVKSRRRIDDAILERLQAQRTTPAVDRILSTYLKLTYYQKDTEVEFPCNQGSAISTLPLNIQNNYFDETKTR